MYAIVKTGGKQYTVKPGDVLDVEKIEGEAGDRVDLQVLLLNDGNKVVADAAEAAKVKVTAEIIDQHKGKKQLVFKFKKRKGYKRTKGHRQQLTKIAIVDVNGVTAEAPKPQAPKAEPKAAEPKAEKPAAQAEAPAEDLSKMTVAQLKDLAAEKGIKVPSGARKAEIVELIQNA